MAVFQLLIIRNYSRRIIGFLCVNCIFIRFFDTGLDPTRPTQDGEFCDPTRPDAIRGWTRRPVSNSAYTCLSLSIDHFNFSILI